MSKIKAGIIGATGYTGSELVRLLHNHPNAEVTTITSESRAGEKFSDVHPFFQDICDLELIKSEQFNPDNVDVIFFALPHGVSMKYTSKYFGKKPIIDFSGDFRLDSPQTYEKWYGQSHTYVSGFEKAVYGMPELFPDGIKEAPLIANPGCFPTGAALAIAPLVKSGKVDNKNIIIDSKTGVTGAGIKSKPVNMFSNVNDNFKAYGLKNHRHTVEIELNMKRLTGQDAVVQFTPHLLPVDRGILTTAYLKPTGKMSDDLLNELYNDFYADAPFIRMRKNAPEIKQVRGTNYADLYTTFDERTGNIIVVSAIDNLVKGAAGQAVHNMNIKFNLNETEGLNIVPFQP